MLGSVLSDDHFGRSFTLRAFAWVGNCIIMALIYILLTSFSLQSFQLQLVVIPLTRPMSITDPTIMQAQSKTNNRKGSLDIKNRTSY